MLTFLARRWAKLRYRFQEEVKTETLLINARSSERTAEKTKLFIAQLRAKADAADAQAAAIEQNIKEVDEKMFLGFWQCENGHEASEVEGSDPDHNLSTDPNSRICKCGKRMKFISSESMTGQEKYENEKERREVEKLADGARQQAAEIRTEIKRQEGEIENHLAIAKSFNDQAKRTRDFAQLLREL
jgi:uncharacterized protein YfcZ (UPF0381/DUF406 family)